ncbi:MAG TPA: 16S rRNA (cytidine(1402)-2'-O)-methyltransferase [Acidimicrobiia bacterium]|nr:16S rRNA (cytidine(1402)-2'-O)-methyltransferase [Acidimicrobiia bacterium]
MPAGRLLVCATPIGNLGDISDRLRKTLAAADVIYAEDTRRTAKLMSHLGLSAPVVSLFAGNEQSRVNSLVESIRSGDTVALVSDAGMPTVSDPGAAAVAAVREAGLTVSVVPGPSAVTSAVALAGFGGDRFVFEGFLPRKGRDRAERLRSIAADTRSVVLFASPNRLSDDLADLTEACGGERRVAVMRELTKLHEESWVGSLADAVEYWSDPVKGEVTVVLAPTKPAAPSVEDAIESARALVADGITVSDAARQIADLTGVSRREIYEALVRDQASS